MNQLYRNKDSKTREEERTAEEREEESLLRKTLFGLNCIFCDLYLVLPDDSTCAGGYAGMRTLYVGVDSFLGLESRAWKCRLLSSEIGKSIRFNGISIVISRVTTLSKPDYGSCEVTAVCPSHNYPAPILHACRLNISGPPCPPTIKRQENVQKKMDSCACNVACYDPMRPQFVLFSRLHRQCASRLARRSARAK